ncbi:MAG TPA: rubredoxin, partial [Anaeromyxobacteraceae bacterium]|nr:rubredoxin [Anaeromyxobacteraceae bacterium]
GGVSVGAAGETEPSDARYECGVCWYRYEPAVGDPVGDVPPGTPFAALPETWTCPTCDAPRLRFLRVADGR